MTSSRSTELIETQEDVVRKLSQKTPVSNFSALPLPNGPQAPTQLQPFQFEFPLPAGQEGSVTLPLATFPKMATFLSRHRRAQLTQLHAVVSPSAVSIGHPLTVQLIWVPASSTTTSSQILGTYGGQQISVGGQVTNSTPAKVSANLLMMNPHIKDSTSYTDTPKLLVYSTPAVPDDKLTTSSASIIVFGEVLLSSPQLNPSA